MHGQRDLKDFFWLLEQVGKPVSDFRLDGIFSNLGSSWVGVGWGGGGGWITNATGSKGPLVYPHCRGVGRHHLDGGYHFFFLLMLPPPHTRVYTYTHTHTNEIIYDF